MKNSQLLFTAILIFALLNLNGCNKDNENSPHIIEPSLPVEIATSRFYTNEGVSLSYTEAVHDMWHAADSCMVLLGFQNKERNVVAQEMYRSLSEQTIESSSRMIGDHGIRHIYGNWERAKVYMKNLSEISTAQYLCILFAITYHDVGYMEYPCNLGSTDDRNNDKIHDSLSEKWLREQSLLYGIFLKRLPKDVVEEMLHAVGTHNTSDLELIRKNVATNSEKIIRILHIADKLALSQNDKMPDILLEYASLARMAYCLYNISDNKIVKQKTALIDSLSVFCRSVADSITQSDTSKPKEFLNRMHSAVKRDFVPGRGNTSVRMNCILVPSSTSWKKDGEKDQITIYRILWDEALSQKTERGQFTKLFEDMGYEEERAKELADMDSFDEPSLGISYKIEHIAPTDSRLCGYEKIHKALIAGYNDYNTLLDEGLESASARKIIERMREWYCR